MKSLFNLFFDICLLRAGPEDVPASPTLFVLALLAYFVSGLVMLGSQVPPGLAFARMVIDVVVLLGVLQMLLRWRSKETRFVQSATAMAGTGSFMQAISLPLVIMIGNTPADDVDAAVFPVMIWLLLLIWSVIIFGHIIRNALESTLSLGMISGVFYLYLSYQVSELIFPL